MSDKKIIFVTGTDTGVGKTLLTALLLQHLRQTGINALAMKPFCSGGRSDVRLLQSLQWGKLAESEMNPFYFKEPVAPLIEAEENRIRISLSEVIERIQRVKAKCDCLLIEGAGGLLVPLGRGYFVADLIRALDCSVIVAARNRLGTINHTLLTVNALKSIGIANKNQVVALMSDNKPDHSSRTNQNVLRKLLKPIEVFSIPFLGPRATRLGAVKINCKKARQPLAAVAKKFALA